MILSAAACGPLTYRDGALPPAGVTFFVGTRGERASSAERGHVMFATAAVLLLTMPLACSAFLGFGL